MNIYVPTTYIKLLLTFCYQTSYLINTSACISRNKDILYILLKDHKTMISVKKLIIMPQYHLITVSIFSIVPKMIFVSVVYNKSQ